MRGPDRLAKEIRARGWTSNEAERRLGCTTGSVSKWVLRIRRPSLENTLRIRELLGIPVEDWSDGWKAHLKKRGHKSAQRKTVRLTTGQKPARASSENPFELLGEDEQ